ncbi:MAG: AraC family transcriptional regulator [Congregibacter sp.]
MSDVPNIYLDDPDPLSVLLGRLELSAEVYVNGAFCGTWAVDTAGSRRIPFHLIGAGEAWLHFGSEHPRQLGDHDLVVFPHDDHHIISNSPKKPSAASVNAPMTNDGPETQMVCGFFEFRNPAIFPVLDELPRLLFLSARDELDVAQVNLLSDMILRELRLNRPGNYAAINQLAFLLFVEILRNEVGGGALSSGLLAALFDKRIGPALNAMHQQPQEPWTLESLAARAAMSRSAFSSRFSSLVKATPMKYLASWRMTEARRLLRTTSLSTAQVAEKSGYESEAAFRKAFKSILGETPGSVRSAKS